MRDEMDEPISAKTQARGTKDVIQATAIDAASESGSASRIYHAGPLPLCFSLFIDLALHKDYWMSGHPLIVFGVALSFSVEILSHAPQYNSAVLIFIFASTGKFEALTPQFMVTYPFSFTSPSLSNNRNFKLR